MMFKGKTYLSLFVLLVLALSLAACGGSTPAATPTAVAKATAAATATTLAPTAVATTAVAPTAVATTEVAATATSNPAPPPTAAPTAPAQDSATPADTGKQDSPPTDTPEGDANGDTGAGDAPTATVESVAPDAPTATVESVAPDAPTATVEAPVATTPAASGAATPEAGIVADLGFRPEVNGFAFENYGGDTGRTNLEAADVRRMFGDVACASIAGGNCILTPPAAQWMDQVNQSMSGGHCEGFASLSLAFYAKEEKTTQYGAPDTVDLKIDGNQALQREIAYYFATQYTSPARDNEIKKTPNEILDLLIAAFKNGATKETYTMGIYQRGFKGGHAITPYAVQDLGGGKFAVLVYDNNYPKITRDVIIDRNANTWNYVASINPNEPASEYEGDASTGTLSITATTPRLQTQVCAFCAPPAAFAPGTKLLAPAQEYNQVWLDGEGQMLLTDKDGHRLGLVDGKLVNEIPGAFVDTARSADLWKDSEPPTLYVPANIGFTISLDGTGLDAVSHSSITMIGPGYDLAVDDIALDPGQHDSITFSDDGKTVKYQTDSNESPTIALGISNPGADYDFEAKGVDIESGGTMTLGIDPAKGELYISTEDNKESGAYSLVMNRIDDAGEQTFGHNDIELDPNSTAYLDYNDWKGDGSAATMTIDTGNDGTIDDTLSLTDQ